MGDGAQYVMTVPDRGRRAGGERNPHGIRPRAFGHRGTGQRGVVRDVLVADLHDVLVPGGGRVCPGRLVRRRVGGAVR